MSKGDTNEDSPTAHGVSWCIVSNPNIFCRHPVNVPTGYAAFPNEVFPSPESWLRNACNLVSYTKMDRGGHFAALEEPEAFSDDVRKFAGIVESL